MFVGVAVLMLMLIVLVAQVAREMVQSGRLRGDQSPTSDVI